MRFRHVDPYLLLLLWACITPLMSNAYAATGTVLTEPVLLAIIAAVTSTVASLITLVVTILNKKKVEEVAVKVEQVEKHTNSMKDALVAATKSEALLVGKAEGKAEEKAKQADKAEAHAAGLNEGKASLAAATDPIPVEVVAAVPVPVRETPSTKGKP